MAASKQLKGDVTSFDGDKKAFVDDLRQALYASKIVSYAQGLPVDAFGGEDVWMEPE